MEKIDLDACLDIFLFTFNSYFNMKKLGFLFLLLSLPSFASIINWEQKFDVNKNGEIEGSIIINTNTSNEIQLFFSQQFDKIEVLDGTLFQIPYSYTNNTLTFTPPLDKVEIRFKSNFFTSKEKNHWKLNITMKSSEAIEKFSAHAKLPPSQVIATNGRVSANNGIELMWSQEKLPADKLFNLRAEYQQNESIFLSFSWFWIGAAIILIIAIWFLYNRKNVKNKTAVDMSVTTLQKPQGWHLLEQEEQQILEEILRTGGKCTQRHLQTYTNLPKATLSRRIQKLERKELIMRIQKGNTNVIALK